MLYSIESATYIAFLSKGSMAKLGYGPGGGGGSSDKKKGEAAHPASRAPA